MTENYFLVTAKIKHFKEALQNTHIKTKKIKYKNIKTYKLKIKENKEQEV